MEPFADASPFASYAISSHQPLRDADEQGRVPCPKCNKPRKFYCYTCLVPVGETSASYPRVQLPVKIDIIKHPNEIDGKSTAVHAMILAPTDATLHSFPDIPEYNEKTTVLVFPSKDAKAIGELDLATVDKIVFVDSTWAQTHRIVTHPRLAKLPRVKIAQVETLFWRPQHGKPATHLATIEAIYQVFRQLADHQSSQQPAEQKTYDGRYDDLLFFFSYQYGLIERRYQGSDRPAPLPAHKRAHEADATGAEDEAPTPAKKKAA